MIPEDDFPTVKEMARKYAEAKVEIERLRAALLDALEDVEHWGAYASEYFQEKWNLAGDIARIREAAGLT